MSKFNQGNTNRPAVSPFITERAPSALTHEGAPGYIRDQKTQAFFLAVGGFLGGEDTFYEKGTDRDERFKFLIRELSVIDPDWVAGFLVWLRGPGNIRTASIIGAAEYVWARRDEQGTGRTGTVHPKPSASTREVVAGVLQRADEPGEILAYWYRNYGKNVPKPLKRGISDAVSRLYHEYSIFKYNSPKRAFSMADVLNISHAKPTSAKEVALYEYLMARRYGTEGYVVPDILTMVRVREDLMDLPVERRRHIVENEPHLLDKAGMTWEALAGWLQGPMDAAAWNAIIPSMGYMALLRNLRNFDQAGISETLAGAVQDYISDPDEVARSRQFPFRIFAAYLAAPSLRWGQALEQALGLATKNIPALDGRTLVLVDTSGSMEEFSRPNRSMIKPVQIAALFGVSIAARGSNVDLHGFATTTFHQRMSKGISVLRETENFCRRIGEVGHGTQMVDAVRRTYDGHDRVIIISDMQTQVSGHWGLRVSDIVPDSVPIYGFNLNGYQHGAIPSGMGNRHEFGGMTDATFKLIPMLEAGQDANWPWLV